jgi:predicted anti-sigma-YlaC factor YlaD
VTAASPRGALAALAAAALLLAGCSLQRLAARTAGRTLAGGGAVWSADDDPQLVRDALPFALKTIESLLAAAPEDPELLLAAASGFTQYAQGFLVPEADELEATDFRASREARTRAVRLLRRARDYGLRGLEVAAPGIGADLADAARRETRLGRLGRGQVPLLYWTAAAWGAGIAQAKDDPTLSADLPVAERLMRRARELDPGFDDGAIHDFYFAWEGARPAAAGGSVARAEEALAAALRFAGGRRAAPHVTFAETVCVATQDRARFERSLDAALAVDAAASGGHRLANILAQRRAAWLRGRADELFVD